MGPSRLSIKDRMRRAKSLAVRVEIAQDWSVNWMADHRETLDALRQALRAGHIGAATQAMVQLDALHGKGFVGLDTVIRALADDDTF